MSVVTVLVFWCHGDGVYNVQCSHIVRGVIIVVFCRQGDGGYIVHCVKSTTYSGKMVSKANRGRSHTAAAHEVTFEDSRFMK